jgi:hypothetical protein
MAMEKRTIWLAIQARLNAYSQVQPDEKLLAKEGASESFKRIGCSNNIDRVKQND